MSAEIGYLTFLYAVVGKDKYQKVTGYARGSTQIGRMVGCTLGQIIVSFNLMNLRELHYITLGGQIISVLISILLPAVATSVYFHSAPKDSPLELNRLQSDPQDKEEVPINPKFSGKRAINLMWHHFVDAYTNHTVIEWSLWWALATAGFGLVHGYSQLLWQQIDPNLENFYNGGVEAVLTFFGALSAFTGIGLFFMIPLSENISGFH
jgi:thiamine transporter 2/3